MKTNVILSISPEAIVTGKDGLQYYQFQHEGRTYEVVLQYFQLGQPIPDKLPCVKYTDKSGEVTFKQNFYAILRNLYGSSGLVELTIAAQVQETNSRIWSVTLLDDHRIRHPMLTRKPLAPDLIGTRQIFRYKLLKGNDFEGRLELHNPRICIEDDYLDPERFLASFDPASGVQEMHRRMTDPTDPFFCPNLLEQETYRNNLWLLTFSVQVKNRMRNLYRERKLDELNRIVEVFLLLERQIQRSEDYLSYFAVDKRNEIEGRMQEDIQVAESTQKALSYCLQGTSDQALKKLYRNCYGKRGYTLQEAQLIMNLILLDSDFMQRNLLSVAQLMETGRREVPLKTPVGNFLKQAVENQIKIESKRINGQYHLQMEPVLDDDLLRLIRCKAIQWRLQSTRGEFDKRIYAAQICRLVSYHYTGDTCKRLQLLAFGFLQGRYGLHMNSIQGGEENWDSWVELLTHPLRKKEVEECVCQGNGEILFRRNLIEIIPFQQLVSFDAVQPCYPMHSLREAPVQISSQFPETVQQNDAIWDKVNLPHEGEQHLYTFVPEEKKYYQVTFRQVFGADRNRASFVLRGPGGGTCPCILYGQKLFTLDGYTMDNVFLSGDTISAQVYRYANGTAYINLEKDIIQYCNRQAKTGDELIAYCFVNREEGSLLYSQEGMLLRDTEHKDLQVGKFYQVRVLEMPLSIHRYIHVETVRESFQKFDARAVNRFKVLEFVRNHSEPSQEKISRQMATELLFLLDAVAIRTESKEERYALFQYERQVALVEHSPISFLFLALCRLMDGETQTGLQSKAEERYKARLEFELNRLL